jgi:hypothetical protein
MTASTPKRSLVSATTVLNLKRRRDACASTATRRHICKVGNFIAGRQVCCRSKLTMKATADTTLPKDGDFVQTGDFSVAGNLVGEANFLEDNFVTSNLSQD